MFIGLFEEWATLRYSWYSLGESAPELTSYLKNLDETITIRWSGRLGYGGIVESRNYESTGNFGILIGTSQKGHDLKYIACTMAHEDFHAAAYICEPASVLEFTLSLK